jgi:hypothetical protein
MPKNKLITTLTGIPQDLDAFGRPLANVTCLEDERETVLGQAWLAGKHRLITCGHVVEGYLQSPQQLVVKFPASGNRYVVSGIKLHPSYLKQKDQLVKFDAAVLKVELRSPEKEVTPLPVRFERALAVNQSVYSVRYPAHLGMITAAPSPLAQAGRILGNLRKHDSFHLLHDLALSQGDSGSPIFVGRSVVAMHCGDTASLPGLNLPTTSIRLALWVDALRELEIEDLSKSGDRQTRTISQKWQEVLQPVSLFVLSLALTFFLFFIGALTITGHFAQWRVEQPAIPPVEITIAKTQNGDSPGGFNLGIRAACDCKAYLLPANDQFVSFDPNGVFDLKAGQETSIPLPALADSTLKTNATTPSEAMANYLKGFFVIVTSDDLDLSKEAAGPGTVKQMPRPQFFNWLTNFESAHRGRVLVFPGNKIS